MRLRRFFRRLAIIQFLLFTAPGDAMIFHTGEFSLPACDWPQMLHRKVETNVTIKFTISWTAWIALLRAPHLPARITITRENGRAGWRKARRVNRAPRRRFSKHQTVRVENEPANVCFLQNRFQLRLVSAFRQPKPDRLGVEKIDIDISPDQNLRARGLRRLLLKNGKQTVRGGAGDDFKRARHAQLAKSGKQITFPFIDKETPANRKNVEIEAGQLLKFLMMTISPSLAHGEIDQKIEVPHVALAQKFILEHGAERRRYRHGELERHTVVY